MSTNIQTGTSTTPFDQSGPAAVSTAGQLWHTIRHDNGSWQDFRLIETQELNDPGPFDGVTCSGIDDPPQLHVVGIVAGQLWHTIRDGYGTWQNQFGHIEPVAGNDPGAFTAVGCAASDELDLGLQVVGIVNGRLWHTIRDGNGNWQDFREIQNQESNDPGAFTAVSCVNDGGFMLHVVGIVAGQLWHTIRNGDGTWQQQYGLIEPVAGNDPGPFTTVGCAAVSGELHVVGTVNGQLWHTIRHIDGSWQAFGLIETQEQNDPGAFTDVSCAATTSSVGPAQLQVAGTIAGQAWHTIRNADGSWQNSFGNVDGAAGNPGLAQAVACGGASDELHLIEFA